MYATIKTENLQRFLYWVEERHRIHLKRLAETEKERTTPRKTPNGNKIVTDPPRDLPIEYLSQKGKPWTVDPVLQNNFFTNPFRENDRTTVWFRYHIRTPLSLWADDDYAPNGAGHPNVIGTSNRPPSSNPAPVIFATIAFRWFNFINTGRILAATTKRGTKINHLDKSLLVDWDFDAARRLLFKQANLKLDPKSNTLSRMGDLPDNDQKVFTGAYIIKPPAGECAEYVATHPPKNEGGTFNKIDAICWCINNVWEDIELLTTKLTRKGITLEGAWNSLTQYPYLGGFMAYEVVSDLRHTHVLQNAHDIMTWANLGPGAMRGLKRVCGLSVEGAPITNSLQLCRDMLSALQDHLYPLRKKLQPLPAPEMREIEHSLCEFDKYERARLGDGKMKRGYAGSH